MEINISEIINAKLAQMAQDGVIKQKMEESLEKTVLNAISSELESYALQKQIQEKVREHIGGIADNLGLEAYNGFLAERVRDIVRDLYTEDISQKVQKKLTDVLLKKHENVKLSDIFKAYRKWVNESVDSEDQRMRGYYTGALEVRDDGNWPRYVCRFAEEPDQEETPAVLISFLKYSQNETAKISSLYLEGHNMACTAKIGYLTEFEAFVANLYFSGTEIELDAESVETDTTFEAAYED